MFNINHILLEISRFNSNSISDCHVTHYGNNLDSRTGNRKLRHFVTTNYDQKSTPLQQPNGISIGSAVFAGLTSVTDCETDQQTILLGR